EPVLSREVLPFDVPEVAHLLTESGNVGVSLRCREEQDPQSRNPALLLCERTKRRGTKRKESEYCVTPLHAFPFDRQQPARKAGSPGSRPWHPLSAVSLRPHSVSALGRKRPLANVSSRVALNRSPTVRLAVAR